MRVQKFVTMKADGEGWFMVNAVRRKDTKSQNYHAYMAAQGFVPLNGFSRGQKKLISKIAIRLKDVCEKI